MDTTSDFSLCSASTLEYQLCFALLRFHHQKKTREYFLSRWSRVRCLTLKLFIQIRALTLPYQVVKLERTTPLTGFHQARETPLSGRHTEGIGIISIPII
nr:hypothetical protein Q903MT_gene5110 [Picea sitchensis]